MEYKYWDDSFSDRGKNPVTMELKIVLFLYLLTRHADYGWNISSQFKKAIAEGKWTDRRGLGDLKYENKVDAALKNMEQSGLIFKYSDVKKQLPSTYFLDNKIDDEITKNPRRTYYSINPMVFYDSEVYTDIKYLFLKYAPQTIIIDQGLRFIQDYKINEMKVISLINNVSKLDFLTVFTTIMHICDMMHLNKALRHFMDDLEKYKDKDLVLMFVKEEKKYEVSEYEFHKKKVKELKQEISISLFDNRKKFEDLKNKYISFLGITEEEYWLYFSEFYKLISERLTKEVYLNR